jgi:tubulin epsilon
MLKAHPYVQLLLQHYCRLEAATAKGTAAAGSSLGGPGAAKAGSTGKPAGGNAAAWDAMNGIAANMLLHLTSSVRFEGTLNTDLNDITMNLVSVWLLATGAGGQTVGCTGTVCCQL